MTTTDPRNHRHARKVIGNEITYVCSCVNTIQPPSGVLRSVSKCAAHRAERKEAGELGQAYYADIGTIDEAGNPRCERYVEQLTEALGPIPQAPLSEARRAGLWAVEVGCGASPYVEAIQDAGYWYMGTDPSGWVADWMRRHYPVTEFFRGRFEDFPPLYDPPWFILAAHCLEHMLDAPGAIAKCAEMLRPGGELWIIIPDDEDPLNPDHTHFFSEDTLIRCLDSAGLVVERMAVRRYIEREQFLYCRARKPG